MIAETLPDRIRISETQYEQRAEWGAIPAGRWNKRLLCWEYPRSPIAAGRILKTAKRLNQPLLRDAGFQELLEGLMHIRQAQDWKGPNAAKAVRAYATMKDIKPYHTITPPWLHQICASAFLRELEAAYLAMEMGTGKTLVAINEILETKAMRSLIVCPKSVIDVWEDEFERHCATPPLLSILTKGTARDKAAQMIRDCRLAEIEQRQVAVIINYDSVWRAPLGDEILNSEWDVVILDEAQRIKTASAKAGKFAYKLRKVAKRRRCLSGTMLPNNRLDAFGQYRFLDPAAFGTNFTRFRARYAIMGGFGDYEVKGWQNEDEYDRILDLFAYRVDKDVLDLPPETDVDRYCEIEGEAARVYANLEDAFISDVKGGVVTAANALTRLLRLQQITSGFVTTEEGHEAGVGDHKVNLLQEVLGDIDPSETVVVFCRFRHDLSVVQQVAARLGRTWGELSGSQDDLERGRIPEGIQVLGVQVQAGGLGVNLIAARYTILYSVGFSLAEYLQAKARTHRGGQDRPVTYIRLIAKGTVDEKVYQALADKREVVDAIMEFIKRGESWIGKNG